MDSKKQNPVVEVLSVSTPGWKVRRYENGMYDGYQPNGDGLTIGAESFSEAVMLIREMELEASGEVDAYERSR